MSTESIRQFPSTVSSDSPLQVPQLVEDQLSEDELETVVGGTEVGGLKKGISPNRVYPTGKSRLG